jgi:hypothetical protein
MRTQVATVGLLGVWAAGLGLVAGCDNITAGQTTDSNAPPQLLHVHIQDASSLQAFPNRASVVDLIDSYVAPACTIYQQANAMANPPLKQIDDCFTQFEIDGMFPHNSCTAPAGSTQGVCADPFGVPSSGVPLATSAQQFGGADPMTDPGGGMQVRLVFDKALDNSIEDVATMATPKTYALHAGIVELDDMNGKPVPSLQYLDNAGSPLFSSDFEVLPLGPAIVIKPSVVLDVATTYTIKILNPSVIKDRQGNKAVGANMKPLALSFNFTTESQLQEAALSGTANPFGSAGYQGTTDMTTMKSVITPNEVIEVPFYGRVAGDKATLTVMSAPAGANPIAFSERGTDPTMCGKTTDPFPSQLDIANADAQTQLPVAWPAGDYDLTFTVTDATGRSTVSDELKFTVSGMAQTDPTMDPNIVYSATAKGGHVLPAQCAM